MTSKEDVYIDLDITPRDIEIDFDIDNNSIVFDIEHYNSFEGGDKHFSYYQGTASDHWIIEHNLSKYPSVSITDSAGSIVFGDVKYISENSLEIFFNGSFSGVAYLN